MLSILLNKATDELKEDVRKCEFRQNFVVNKLS